MKDLASAIQIRDIKESLFHQYSWSLSALQELLVAEKEVQILSQQSTLISEDIDQAVASNNLNSPTKQSRRHYRRRGGF